MAEDKAKLGERYERARVALLRACVECNIPFDYEKYPEGLNILVSKSDSVTKIYQALGELKTIIKEHYYPRWRIIIDKSYDLNDQKSIIMLIDTMIERESDVMLVYMEEVCDMLIRLGHADEKDEILKYVEDYCSRNSLENVTNKWGILFDSKYRKELNKYARIGFKKNREIIDEYIDAFYSVERN